VPIATPFVGGLSLLAAIMPYAKKIASQLKLFLSIFLAWLACLIIMIIFTRLKNILKDKGTKAIERLRELILVLCAVPMLEEGTRYFLETIG